MRCLWPALAFCFISVGIVCGYVTAAEPVASDSRFQSHPPTRPLPTASARPMEHGPSRFVDVAKGDDQQDGSQAKPWKTLRHAVAQLKSGDTLYLRGGVYYEHVTVDVSGTTDKPITIRSYPNELAIIDGGLREFFENPASAWEPCPTGVPGEFWSTRTYPNLDYVLGNFGDSMVPLQGYTRTIADLRDSSMAWDISEKVGDKEGVYCGPGVFYDSKTGRIHCRLAHTTIKALREDNYRGETDPRKIPLVLGGAQGGPALAVRAAEHVRFQDLVARGGMTSAVEVADCAAIELDGVIAYGGSRTITVRDTAGFRMVHAACRGVAAPWTFRGHLKYRSTEARLLSASGWEPTGADNRDFEIAYCEFTDSVDGVFIGNVSGVDFHHNLVDNISDDGVFQTSTTGYDGITPGGNIRIHENLLSRCLTTFAFGIGHGRQKMLARGNQTGKGVFIYRNVFDFRRPVMYHMPDPDEDVELPSRGRFASDHGSPAWEPMAIYHNTIIADDPPATGYGAYGLGNGLGGGARRQVLNNIVVQVSRPFGLALPEIEQPTPKSAEPTRDALDSLLDEADSAELKNAPESREVDAEAVRAAKAVALKKREPPPIDFLADGNTFWSTVAEARLPSDYFASFRQSKAFSQSQSKYKPGWTTHDQFADPKFVALSGDWRTPLDLRLEPDSPAIDAGVDLGDDLPDPLRRIDKGRPDTGALPVGVAPWRVGVQGRLTMFSELQRPPLQPPTWERKSFVAAGARKLSSDKPVALIVGYPEGDAPLIRFVFRQQGIGVEEQGHTWLKPEEYSKYRLVIVTGDMQRAGIKPDAYTAGDLAVVEKFLRGGGTLWLSGRAKRIFDLSPAGRKFLDDLTEPGATESKVQAAIQQPRHPWVKHLDPYKPHAWLDWRPDTDTAPWRATAGTPIIASPGGTCMLYQVRVGQGQIIYLGWSVANALPVQRWSRVEHERQFEEQVQILASIVADLFPAK